MKLFRRSLFFLLALFTFQSVFAELNHVSGSLVNGRGGIEKCDDVSVTLIINSRDVASTTSDESGAFSFDLTGLTPDQSASPNDFTLDQNYPNPFNENTTLPYNLNSAGKVSLDIYDLRGHRIRSIIHEHQPSGYHLSLWDGRNDNRQICSQGIYFYIMRFNGRTEIKKMTLMNSQLLTQSSPGSGLYSFTKSATETTIELRIEDKDIENKTVEYSFTELPSSLDAGNIQLHVYAFLRTAADTISTMEGECVDDTLDIYFEKPFILSLNMLPIDYEFTHDSLSIVHYTNVSIPSSILRINEIDESKTNYAWIKFTLVPRLSIWNQKLRRAYIGIPYSRGISTINSEGETELTLQNSLPGGLSFLNNTIQGTPSNLFEGYLTFDLEDDRNMPVSDSTLLIIGDTANIDFKNYVVDVLEEYPRNGSHPYKWVSGYTGVTKDLYYKGVRIAKANPDSSYSCYCCGLTFENFFSSVKRLNQDLGHGEDINGMTASNFSNFISIWFVQSAYGDGPGLALEAYGLGDKIEKMQDVLKGDFVQIWRTTGSGHSVIFINWTTNSVGDTSGFKYWSTQPSTNGINYNTEYFDGYGGTIDKAHTYYSRGRKPEDFTSF